MNILISNDDGVAAPGIRALAQTLSKKHNVFVLAPDQNRSAISNAFTLFLDKPLCIKKVSENMYSCSGTPVDCVITGLTSNLFDVKIDAVVSGINCGPNLGRDIVYSGTCAAARQGIFYDIPSVAVSLKPENWENAGKLDYSIAADFVLRNLETLLSFCEFGEKGAFVNVNVPDCKNVKGVKLVSEYALKKYGDKVNIIKKGDEYYTQFESDEVDFYKDGTDYDLCKNGYITVSKVLADAVMCTVVDGGKLS